MNLAVFAVVLFAAALHATWNAVVKGGADTLLTTALVVGFAAAIAVIVLPFVPQPAPASWPFILASTTLQVAYFLLVAYAYRAADMSQTYPLMRGTAPLLVAFASAALLDEPLPPLAWIGIAAICAGILSMGLGVKPGQGKGVLLALLNAVVIAAYTLIDGEGVRRSGSPVAYTLWIYLITGGPFAAWVAWRRRAETRRYLAANWRQGIVGGIGTTASYGLALWAMTVAPIAVVAALRETSTLFGAAISGLILHEKLTPVRIAGVCVIAAGAIALRLA